MRGHRRTSTNPQADISRAGLAEVQQPVPRRLDARTAFVRSLFLFQILLSAALASNVARSAEPPALLVDYFEAAGTVFPHTDDQGVALVDYGGQLGVQYNPVYIGQAALALYYAFQRSGEEQFKQRFLKQVRWLVSNAKPIGKGHDVRAYAFHFEWGELKPGWRSGLAQAQGISALIRAYYVTRDESLLPVIRALVRFMYVPVEHGGVQARTPEGNAWVEEFPFKASSHVLNGHIFVVFALYEYTRLFRQDEAALRFYQQCLSAVESSLRHYDSGTWQNVDRYYRDAATENYVRTHTEQLRWLYLITGNALFSHVRLRWLAFSMERSPHNRTNVVRMSDGRHYAPPVARGAGTKKLSLEDVLSHTSTPAIKGHGVEAMLEDNPSKYFAPEQSDINARNPHFVALRLKRPQRISGLRVRLYNPELYPRDADIEVRSRTDEAWRKLTFQKSSEGRDLIYRFTATDATEIRFSSTSTAGQNRLVLGAISLETGEPRAELPEIGNYLSEVFYLESQRFRTELKTHGLLPHEIVVQYRCAAALTHVFTSPWAFDFLAPGDVGPLVAKQSYCQFRITHVANKAGAAWSGFEVVPVGSH